MSKLQEALFLSDKGYKDLKKAVFACTLTNLAMIFPFCVTVMIFSEILTPAANGGSVQWNHIWMLWGAGIISALLVFLAAKNDYRKTYIASYQESNATRLRIADHLRKLPMSFFNTKDLSELTTNMMADCSSMESLLSSTIPPLIANGITVTITSILLAFFDWRLALCVFCTVPIAFLIIWLSRKRQIKLFEKQVDAKLEASDQVQEYLEGMKIIKSCGLSGSRFKTLDHALLAMKKIAVKVEMTVGVFMSGASMVLQAGIGITIFVGAVLLTSGQIELIPLLMFLLMVTRIYGPILSILANLSSLLNLNVVTNRMRTLLTTPAMAGEEKTVDNCDIELSHVTFAYNQDNVIKDVSCKIPQGSVTALVGPSGSGKSTISKLIARFWDIQKGTITVGGKDIKTMEPESLMSYMSFVFQDVTLFNDTVMNNIRIGNPNAADEQVIAAAKAAYCDEFVREMPDGYQTLLGENGSTLSGGERQRISIARALLKNAPIILLDEATASLDPENEVLVQRAIAKLVEGKTVIMIAHRLRTVVDADQILVLEAGRLVESGTHNELMEKKGLYQRLYHIQQESLGWAV
ncbi:ABC transporter ATP-binding protein [Mediterraneibacter glycyrrhizinilyticus]|nr:ABC transporter ATP-binding protein [Mediterraneibacter glycyrrhizinilyticus]MBM6853885.1 ABC transporter ATP-binding protein [Mediterraneibacter glycyrrhizinilyticus]